MYMKHTLLFAAVILLSACGKNSKNTTATSSDDITQLGLQGNVATVISTQTQYMLDTVTGQMIPATNQDIMEYEFNPQKMLTKQKNKGLDNVIHTYNYTYDADGLKVSRIAMLLSDSLVTTKNFTYNSKGLIYEIESLDGNGRQFDLEASTYNEKDQLTERQFSGLAETNFEKYTYHPDGKLAKIEYITGEGQLLGYSEDIYNELGQLVESFNTEQGRCWYNQAGDIVRTEQFKFGYNDKGDMTLATDNDNQTIETYEYEYDSNGNWIKLTTKDAKGAILSLTERVITYQN